MDSNSTRFASVASLCSGDILRPLSVPSMAFRTSSTMTSLNAPRANHRDGIGGWGRRRLALGPVRGGVNYDATPEREAGFDARIIPGSLSGAPGRSAPVG